MNGKSVRWHFGKVVSLSKKRCSSNSHARINKRSKKSKREISDKKRKRIADGVFEIFAAAHEQSEHTEPHTSNNPHVCGALECVAGSKRKRDPSDDPSDDESERDLNC